MNRVQLRVRRKALGLTLAQVGAAAGISRCRVSDYEAGRRRLTLRVQLRLAEVLQVDVSRLLGMEVSDAER